LRDHQLERGLQIPLGRLLRQRGRVVHFYLAGTAVPVLGAQIMVTPTVNGVRAAVHAVLFVVFFYFGYIRK
jgi:hypothetical protein